MVFVWISAFLWDEAELLTHFSSLFHFYTPWKCQKAKGFQGVQNEHWAKLGKGLKESLFFQTVVPFKFTAVFSLTVYMAYFTQNYGFVWNLKVFSWKQIRLHTGLVEACLLYRSLWWGSLVINELMLIWWIILFCSFLLDLHSWTKWYVLVLWH